MGAVLENPVEWLSPTAAAARLGCSKQWANLLADRGDIKAVRTSIGRLFDPVDVERYRRERAARQQAAEEVATA